MCKHTLRLGTASILSIDAPDGTRCSEGKYIDTISAPSVFFDRRITLFPSSVHWPERCSTLLAWPTSVKIRRAEHGFKQSSSRISVFELFCKHWRPDFPELTERLYEYSEIQIYIVVPSTSQSQRRHYSNHLYFATYAAHSSATAFDLCDWTMVLHTS